jgi:hypothetical protein
MSGAFVKEEDDQWLHEIAPTVTALVNYLTKENNGIRVYEKRRYPDLETGKEVYEMSNGIAYSIDSSSRWFMID